MKQQQQQEQSSLLEAGLAASSSSISSSTRFLSDTPRNLRASQHSVAVSRPYSCSAAKSACAKHREQRDEATAVASWLANRTLVPRAGLTAAQRLDALRSRVREREAAQ